MAESFRWRGESKSIRWRRKLGGHRREADFIGAMKLLSTIDDANPKNW
ncbi:hypothetical protein RE6C_04281 [Rhodopirellula europaea 6C]|uniref:Uncharacterized protein n=1 Tax=Rhodopirellula europaea 6C TaxID=1263867 RepID=M2AY81_9BACT|nr:hypothetical protein RE6C_04281 [Rhodopirellula europaea 6C]